MGNWKCQRPQVLPNNEVTIQELIARAIDKDNMQAMKKIKDSVLSPEGKYALASFTVDQPIIQIQGFEINAAAYSMRMGRLNMFKYLIEEWNASIPEVEKCFQPVGKTALGICWENNLIDLVKYYLPLWLQNQQAIQKALKHEDDIFSDSFSLFSNAGDAKLRTNFSTTGEPISISTFTPIQRACDKNHLYLVQYLYNYFEPDPPIEFDVHLRDEKTGENCALIAWASGNLALIQYLFETCHANFHVLNRRGESSLLLALVSNKRQVTSQLLPIVLYLVEDIGVDIAHDWEETLLVIENLEILDYIQIKLRQLGIKNATKSVIEQKYALKNPKDQHNQSNENLRGTEFNFVQLVEEEQ